MAVLRQPDRQHSRHKRTLYLLLTPFPRRETSSEPSMAVGALGRGGRQGRPWGRLVAPDGSPGPPKCEVQ